MRSSVFKNPLIGIPRVSTLCLILILILSCEEDEPKISQESNNYLESILGIMQNYSINKKTIDWQEFRSQVKAKAGAAQKIADTYPAIKLALGLLADNHSFLRRPDNQTIWNSQLSCSDQVVGSISPIQNIGYIKIPGFSGTSTEAGNFAQEIQDQIKAQDRAELKGWIVDLRNNGGGNMWPMLAGIGPILGAGVVGHFIDPDNNTFSWSYASGTVSNNGIIIQTVSEPYQLINNNPKVAVLTDQRNGSSGEAIVIAFVGRPNTRSFGRATCGLSTANQGYPLSDGSTLYLTVSYMADRNKKLYGGPVVPDEVITTNTETLQRAIDWINE